MPNSGPNDTFLSEDISLELQLPVIGFEVHTSTRIETSAHWEDIKADDIQVVVIHHPNGFRTLANGLDEYNFEGNNPRPGLMLDDERYEAIYQAALTSDWRWPT